MAALPVYIDLRTGRLRQSETDNAEVALRAFIAGDKLQLALRFVDADALVTSTVLATGAAVRTTVRLSPSVVTDVLAEATAHTLSGQIATITLDLDTEEVDALFPLGSPDEYLVGLEFRITAASSAAIESFQFPLTLRRALAAA